MHYYRQESQVAERYLNRKISLNAVHVFRETYLFDKLQASSKLVLFLWAYYIRSGMGKLRPADRILICPSEAN